jgi:hypothetical protein
MPALQRRRVVPALLSPKSGLTKMRGLYYPTNAQALSRGVLV